MPIPTLDMSPDFLGVRPKRSDVQPVMFGGEGAVGAPVETLKQAKEMQAAGAPAEDIFAKTQTPKTTGWFQGPENKWRFEFSDKEAQLNPQVLEQLYAGKPIQLEQLLSHPQLFQYYPHLKEVKIEPISKDEMLAGLKGSYNPKTNVLQVNNDPAQARSTLLHELQHMIQTKEKWAKGGGDAPAEFAKLWSSSKTVNTLMNVLDEKNRITEEFEKKLNEAKRNQDYDLFRKLLDERDNAWREENKKYEKAKAESDAFEKKANEFKRSFSDYEIYRRLGGETEARNVQNRLMMDLLARQKSLPTTTQDYPHEGQLSITEKD